MPAESKKQRDFFGLVRCVQKGGCDFASDKVKKVAKEMKPKSVSDYAKTKEKGLPEKVKESEIISFKSFLQETDEDLKTEVGKLATLYKQYNEIAAQSEQQPTNIDLTNKKREMYKQVLDYLKIIYQKAKQSGIELIKLIREFGLDQTLTVKLIRLVQSFRPGYSPIREGISKEVAAKVYHRDYEVTKDRPYRKNHKKVKTQKD